MLKEREYECVKVRNEITCFKGQHKDMRDKYEKALQEFEQRLKEGIQESRRIQLPKHSAEE